VRDGAAAHNFFLYLVFFETSCFDGLRCLGVPPLFPSTPWCMFLFFLIAQEPSILSPCENWTHQTEGVPNVPQPSTSPLAGG